MRDVLMAVEEVEPGGLEEVAEEDVGEEMVPAEEGALLLLLLL